MLLTLFGVAWASTTHLRAAALPPQNLRQQDREVRVWWDQDGQTRQVEAAIGGRWKLLEEQAWPGVTVGPLPIGTLLRVSEAGVAGEPFSPVYGLSSADLARVRAPLSLPGQDIADIAPSGDSAWVALLEGGLARVEKQHLDVRSWGLAEGLPHPQVNTVLSQGDLTWLGTPAGLVRVKDGLVDRVWDADDGLPDDWVQALGLDSDGTLWVGTYRGLALLQGDTPRKVLGPWSVFSLMSGLDRRVWVGYEGLRGLPQGEPIEGVYPELRVWDVDIAQPRVYLATDAEGLQLLEEGFCRFFYGPPGDAVYALQRTEGVLWAAAGEGGLVRIDEATGQGEAWTLGMPPGPVVEVVEGPPGKLWVGTLGGFALAWPEREVVVPWPVSPLAAGLGAGAVLAEESWALLGTDTGLVALGELPRRWRDALALPGPVRALAQDGRSLWVVTQDRAWLVGDGPVQSWPLSVEARHAAFAGGSVWVSDGQGLYRLDRGLQRLVATGLVGPINGLSADPLGFLWVAGKDRVYAVDAAGRQKEYLRTHAPRALTASAGGPLIGSSLGVERLNPMSGDAVELLGAGGVLALAAGPDGAYAWMESGEVIDLQGGLPLVGLPPLETLGEPRGAWIDGVGRLWLAGSKGFVMLAR